MATKEGRRIATKLLLAVAAVVVAAPCAEAQGGFITSPPPSYGSGGGGFSVTTALLLVAIIVGFFFLGFFSFYIRRWVDRRAAAAAAAPGAEAEARGGGGGGGGRARRRRGLDPAAVETLPTMEYAAARAMMKAWGAGEGEKTLECAVCLAEFADEGEALLRLLPGCCHVFHRDCIDPWLESHVTCPVCRADLSDPAVLAAADAAAAAPQPDPAEVDVETGNHRAPIAAPRSEHQRSRSAAEDRFTLRLPEHVRREIVYRRAASLSGCGGGGGGARRSLSVGVGVVGGGGGGGGGGFGTTMLRTLSGLRYKKESEAGVIYNFIGAPTGETSGGGCVSEIRDPGSANSSFKCHARSITLAGFVLQGDVAARDWRPEVFQVSSSLRSATSLAQ